MTRFTLNGADVEVGAHPHLLAALREELDVTSPKDGCSPSGQCGCCTVLVDGKATVSCSLDLAKVEGKAVTTLEGLDVAERDRYAAAFGATGALQCGFCTPGIVMRCKYLLDKEGGALTREKAARHLGGHLCRCTGYHPILDAVEMLSTGREVDVEVATGVGSRSVKYQAAALAMGDKDYVDDMRVPGLLHAAVVLAEHARADVLAIDTTPAEAVPGVVRVFTAADVPGALRIGIIYEDWPVFIPVGGRTSYLGDVMALVVADSREAARNAAALVAVAYRPLTPIVDPVAAVADGADDAVWELDGNVLSRSTYARGDIEAALAASAHVVHEVFQTQRIEHAFLEPESTLAVPQADGPLLVYSGGQGVWDDRNQVASVLGIGRDDVVVHLVDNGGAFGGKEDASNQVQTALAAHLLGRPVKCTFSREESLLVHPKRHPIRIDATAGCDADGRLTALKIRAIGDSGPYASVGMKVLERCAGHASGPYVWPTIDVDAIAARTNNPVCGAFRGFGANQAQFATEGLLDRLAALAGIDAWEIRARNVVMPGDVWGPGQVMDDGCLGARDCLDAVKPAWEAAVAAGKAVGLGLGLKNSGLGNGLREVAKAVVRFDAEAEGGGVEVRHCWTEMGQGVHTVALQVAVEELGVDPAKVRVVVDTTRELGAGQTTGSRGTLMGAGSVAEACKAALADGCRPGVDYTGEHVVDWTDKLGTVENPTIHSAFGYASQLVIMDRQTGAIEKVVAAHDVGRAVNPLLCEGQVLGAVHMGLGYALSEDFPADADGRPTATTLRQLAILRPKDMPPVDVVLVERPQPRAPYGIKGVGEIGLVPTAGAVAAALHDLDGEWRATLPMRRSSSPD
ncbi:MAG: molybdopterin-dependent oxidoreductase [Actinomycetota bacterium]|nr:molybdopterin-dependent oxidoreductase [Acidimicrobiia bacterium]MDQ3293107.1 molybdopterin-dependent oxidoreductase [Actinomycetota bacterium]